MMKTSICASSLPSSVLDRTCRVLLLLCLAGACYRHLLFDTDTNKCDNLLNEGSWLDPGPHGSDSAYQHWQPRGCMMHKYTQPEIEECMGGKKIIIAGDSTGRQIFEALAEKTGRTMEDVMHHRLGGRAMHHNMEFVIGDTKAQFIWTPKWNKGKLKDELNDFHWDSFNSTESAGLIFLRAPGLWLAKDMRGFNLSTTNAFDHIEPRYTEAVGDATSESNTLFISPVQIPAFDLLVPHKKELFQPDALASQNEFLRATTTIRNIPLIWSHAEMVQGQYSLGTHLDDGIHLTKNIREAQLDVVLNLRCNAKQATKGFPYDRTCCMAYASPGPTQLIIMAFQLILLAVCCWRWTRACLSLESATDEGVHIVEASFTFLVVLCFCFLADRTHTFEKAHKLFSWLEFSIAGLLSLVLGTITIRHIKVPQTLSLTQGEDDLFLSHMQTDEWKGWMQVLILIYHYTGASSVAEIYKIIRLVVSAYIFLTGYGNTLSLLQKPEFTFRKAAATLLRLNILSISLSYMMGTNYLFYYFPALATFWYLVTYTTLGIRNRKNDNMLFIFCKMLIAILATTSFILVPGIMEAVGGALFYIFRINWDVQEWRFRMRLDLFVAYVGMIVAILRQRSQNNLQIEKNSQYSSWMIVRQLSAYKYKLGMLLICLLGGGYVATSRTLPGKYDYNQIHPYVSWIPILGFVALRNSCSTLRSYHSTLFAWVGKISLETYLLQYHIWLAADTKGLLRIGLLNRYIEAAMITAVFLWISWRLSEATRVVVRWLTNVPPKQTQADGAQDSGYALLLSSGDDEEGRVNDAIDTSQSAEDLETVPPNRRLVPRGRFMMLFSRCRSVFSDLRWRMFMIVVLLWVANLQEAV